MADLADADAKERIQNGESLTTSSTILVICMVVASVLVGVILGAKIANGIRKPLNEVEEVAKKLAEGDLNVAVQYDGKDELGNLAESMRQLTDALTCRPTPPPRRSPPPPARNSPARPKC